MTSAPWPSGDLAHHLDEILLAIVDGANGAERLAVAHLGGAADRGDDLGAERARDLDCGRADAATAAMHEQPLAGLEIAALEDIVPDGEYGLGQRGSLIKG